MTFTSFTNCTPHSERTPAPHHSRLQLATNSQHPPGRRSRTNTHTSQQATAPLPPLPVATPTHRRCSLWPRTAFNLAAWLPMPVAHSRTTAPKTLNAATTLYCGCLRTSWCPHRSRGCRGETLCRGRQSRVGRAVCGVRGCENRVCSSQLLLQALRG